MKKSFIISVFLIILTNLTFGQKLTKDEVDSFTNKTVKETSWETLNKKSSLYSYVRFRKVDSIYILGFKMMIGNKVYSVDEGEVLLFKFMDDEIIKIKNSEYQLTTYGAGATGLAGSNMLGINLTCVIDKKILEKLKAKPLMEVRVYTSDGYAEAEVKNKQADKFMELASLIN